MPKSGQWNRWQLFCHVFELQSGMELRGMNASVLIVVDMMKERFWRTAAGVYV